ncbi:hypothetical protein GOP47_0024455 [Adiantum capillus-veneris]|uniref:Uncharacterized protein n=1 Tax=Adiantum capillus-veneris TaxID=13818 RepID=A0A9D4U268_ADICA|nr:hypothetical protein GOP47_0024455 [Adiantum capillus-veneris]
MNRIKALSEDNKIERDCIKQYTFGTKPSEVSTIHARKGFNIFPLTDCPSIRSKASCQARERAEKQATVVQGAQKSKVVARGPRQEMQDPLPK